MRHLEGAAADLAQQLEAAKREAELATSEMAASRSRAATLEKQWQQGAQRAGGDARLAEENRRLAAALGRSQGEASALAAKLQEAAAAEERLQEVRANAEAARALLAAAESRGAVLDKAYAGAAQVCRRGGSGGCAPCTCHHEWAPHMQAPSGVPSCACCI